MKKILTILLAVAMIFTFIACDQPTGGKDPVNNSGSGNNQSNQDPFVAIQSTLTEKVESPDEINWDGTWDCSVTMTSTEENIGTFTEISKGCYTIANNVVEVTLTSLLQSAIYVDKNEYNDDKSMLQEQKDADYYKSVTFDDEKLTIVAETNVTSETNTMTLEEFLIMFEDFTIITTNTAKTAVMGSYIEDDESLVVILIKR